MARLGHILLTVILVAAFAAAVATRWFSVAVKSTGPLTTEKLVYIAPGTPIRGIAATLLGNGIIRNDLVFILDARWRNRTRELKAGEYEFHPGMTVSDVITLLQSGKTYQRRITIPEGLMSFEIVDVLKNEPVLAGEIDSVPPEGSLLPETYHFTRGDTRQGVLERMKKSMQAELGAQWEKRAADLPLKTPAEAVILASVVEKETGLASERPRVAGVFINRLSRSIPLQSDPTVIYAVTLGKEKLLRPLTYNDLKMPSPYNTYAVQGLPPGPIANPGRASLAAVLNPEKNDYIYFVADGTGGHAFARTLQEHNNNVARWRTLQKSAR